MTTSLRNLPQGDKGRIVRVDARGETGRRMRDMGLVSGALVEMKACAPLRDPVALRLDGVTVALRNSEADTVTVEVVSA